MVGTSGWSNSPCRVARWALAACLLLAYAPAVIAQSGRVDIDSPQLVIEAFTGWDGNVDETAPIPISFLFHNYSERVIRGHLTLSARAEERGDVLEEIVLGPGSTRRFVTIQAMPDRHECFAALRDGERILWRRALNLASGNGFDPRFCFALFIEATRKLQLPGPSEIVSNIATPAANVRYIRNDRNNVVVAGEEGRPIRCLTVQPWQVPNHAGPLSVASVIIFPEDAVATDLNRAQWRAVADWMCQGGAVFAHTESSEIITLLRNSAPLGGAAPFSSDEFLIRRIGLGTLYEYPRGLFSEDGGEIRQLIGETIAKRDMNHSQVVGLSQYYPDHEGQADLNRILVVVFFAIYALFAGLGALLLFRASQRRIAIYTIAVVCGASVIAGLLGGSLRASRGDLSWMSVTQVGAGGAVQSGRIEIQSAGGRNELVALKGQHPDLQLIQQSRYSSRWNREQAHFYPPFTWQPDLAKQVSDAYQISVPITPWGRRQLRGTTYIPDLTRMDFELTFQPADSDEQQPGANSNEEIQQAENPFEPARQEPPPPRVPRGSFSLKLKSDLPFAITDCWLVIGVTAVSAVDNQLVDVYHARQLPPLAAGATYQEEFEGDFRALNGSNDMRRWFPGGSIMAPQLSHLGEAKAWIMGEIDRSPGMAIDAQLSDFVPQNEFHVLVQEILPEDMPDPSVFIDYDEVEDPAEPVDKDHQSEADDATQDARAD